jgi:hypothetical protein
MFEFYRNRMAMRGENMSEMLRTQSRMVIEQTWDRDPNFRRVYVVKVDSGLPMVTVEHELIDAKFNIKSYQTITSDEVAYMLQFRHGEEKRHPEVAIGSYVYMEDEDGEWKWWLLVHLDERPQFRQYQILECNWTLGWIVDNNIYHCLAVQRVQQSYNSGSWDGDRLTFTDNVTSVWLPTNNDTLTIGYNQRFLISDEKRFPPICYQTSKIEDTQPVGLTKLKFTQETFNPTTDNYELMLADYYSSSITPEVPNIEEELKGTAAITYNGTKPTVKVGGSFKVFTPAFSDETVTVAKWTISDTNGDISANTENYTIEYDGDKLKLKVALNYNLIGTVLIVQLIGSDNSVAELSVEVIG